VALVPSRADLARADTEWWGDVTVVGPEWELDALPEAVRTSILGWSDGRTFGGTAASDVLTYSARGALPFLTVGLAGNDIIIDRGWTMKFPGDSPHQANILGGPGDDWIDGDDHDDMLAGGTGNDTLYGGPGANYLIGGNGDDLLDASIGTWHGFWWHTATMVNTQAALAETEVWRPDTLDGGEGYDTLIGSWGDDLLDGGTGYYADYLRGQDGADTLIGGQGNDTLLGENHDDRLDGGEGEDLLQGGNGGDKLEGGDGFDLLQGGNGDDILDGGAHRDTLDGGSGSDALIGDGDEDRISGGWGNDWIHAGNGNDTVDGGAGDDIILLGAGDDWLLARDAHGRGDDRIDGGDGNDRIHGGYHEDRIVGGAGNDTLNGGAGDDILTGGAGADTFEIRGLYGAETITDFNFDEGDRVLIQEGIYGITEDNFRTLLTRTFFWEDDLIVPLSADRKNLLIVEGHGETDPRGFFEHFHLL